MPFNIGSRCSNKKYWKFMFDLIISFHVVPKSTVKHTDSAQVEIVIIYSWSSLNPHSVHGNCRTCDPLGLEVASSCKETQTRVRSLVRCSLLYSQLQGVFLYVAVVTLRTLDFLVYAQVPWRRESKNISWNFILPLMPSLTFQIHNVWLTLQINCCVPDRSFPKLGVEGRCLPNCTTGKALAGPFQFLDL